MPNLIEMKPATNDEGIEGRKAVAVKFEYLFNYAILFPKLQTLTLHRNYVEKDLFPEFVEPAESMKVLNEIPHGISNAVMSRIERLFPNLNVLRAPTMYEHEDLLESIWEFCSNVEELCLTLD